MNEKNVRALIGAFHELSTRCAVCPFYEECDHYIETLSGDYMGCENFIYKMLTEQEN